MLIINHESERMQVEHMFEETRIKEPPLMNRQTGIRKDTQLKVHIVDANNLPASDAHMVVLQQDGKEAETNNSAVGPDPIWNEAILFKITDPKEKLKVTVKN